MSLKGTKKRLTLGDLKALSADITLPHGWDLSINVDGSELWLQVVCKAGKCNVTGKPLSWKGRKWRLSHHMTKSEIVQTALMATLAAVEHETREAFLYKGEAIFDPHYDVEALHVLRASNALDARD